MVLDERPHALYRFFGAGGTLLYIGITADLPSRITSHRDEKAWWLSVANVTVEHFADRGSVLEAEKRAIVAERPLYNIQHSQPPMQAPPKRQPTAAGSLTPVCVECVTEIPRGDKGVVHVVSRQAYVRLEALQADEGRERIERAASNGIYCVNVGDLMRRYDAMPAEARWSVHCDACNPHFDDESRTWCDGCYWFSVDRCRSWADLVEWTCHLSEKDWLRATNWMSFIRQVANATSKTGLVNPGRGAVG